MSTNILLLSVGTRNKIVEYFRRSIGDNGVVVATDMSELSPAIYSADKYYIVPPISAPNYVDTIIEICKKDNISGVLSLIDPELSILAKYSQLFNQIGTTVIGSSYELCEMSLDKYKMYCWLDANNYKCARSWIDVNEFNESLDKGETKFPVIIKPVKGSASESVIKAYDKDIVSILFKRVNDLIIQEYLDGQEIGADVYIDLISGEVISIFTKKKIRMRAGETDKSVSFKDPKLFKLIEEFVSRAGYRGQIDIDLFLIDGEYYFSEVNPRFGGGYPHAYESGADHMSLIVNNLSGQCNQKCIGAYIENTYMLKYNEVLIR